MFSGTHKNTEERKMKALQDAQMGKIADALSVLQDVAPPLYRVAKHFAFTPSPLIGGIGAGKSGHVFYAPQYIENVDLSVLALMLGIFSLAHIFKVYKFAPPNYARPLWNLTVAPILGEMVIRFFRRFGELEGLSYTACRAKRYPTQFKRSGLFYWAYHYDSYIFPEDISPELYRVASGFICVYVDGFPRDLFPWIYLPEWGNIAFYEGRLNLCRVSRKVAQTGLSTLRKEYLLKKYEIGDILPVILADREPRCPLLRAAILAYRWGSIGGDAFTRWIAREKWTSERMIAGQYARLLRCVHPLSGWVGSVVDGKSHPWERKVGDPHRDPPLIPDEDINEAFAAMKEMVSMRGIGRGYWSSRERRDLRRFVSLVAQE
ncbi:MAG: hypothetical protein QXO86_01360 [Nitrososphaerota archaeon]